MTRRTRGASEHAHLQLLGAWLTRHAARDGSGGGHIDTETWNARCDVRNGLKRDEPTIAAAALWPRSVRDNSNRLSLGCAHIRGNSVSAHRRRTQGVAKLHESLGGAAQCCCFGGVGEHHLRVSADPLSSKETTEWEGVFAIVDVRLQDDKGFSYRTLQDVTGSEATIVDEQWRTCSTTPGIVTCCPYAS